MFWVGDHRGVPDPPTVGNLVFFLTIKPGIRFAVVGFHPGDDQVGMLQDKVCLGFIDPGAVDTAGGVAVGPTAALHPGSLMKARIDPFWFFHLVIVPLVFIFVGGAIMAFMGTETAREISRAVF